MSAKMVSGQIINGSFEIWDTTFTASYASDLISLYHVANPKGGVVNHWVTSSPFGFAQTTDSYSGNYSIILHNWYNEVPEWISYHQAIGNRPQYLLGYYKYITDGANDPSQGQIKVTLTRFNGTTDDTIATGSFLFDSSRIYIPFHVDLNYKSVLNPDSIYIYIVNTNNIHLSNAVSHLLYLDSFSLTNTLLSVNNPLSSDDQISIYPNPVSGILNIAFFNENNRSLTFDIYDIEGRCKIKGTTTTGAINIEDLEKGFYSITIISGKNVFVKKVLKN